MDLTPEINVGHPSPLRPVSGLHPAAQDDAGVVAQHGPVTNASRAVPLYDRALATVVNKSGLAATYIPRQRHTAATHIVQGADDVGELRAIADLLGHNPEMLMNTYAHALPKSQSAVVNRIGRSETVTEATRFWHGADGSVAFTWTMPGWVLDDHLGPEHRDAVCGFEGMSYVVIDDGFVREEIEFIDRALAAASLGVTPTVTYGSEHRPPD